LIEIGYPKIPFVSELSTSELFRISMVRIQVYMLKWTCVYRSHISHFYGIPLHKNQRL